MSAALAVAFGIGVIMSIKLYMPTENSATIKQWADDTFGFVTVQRSVARANEEMAELIRLAAMPAPATKLLLNEAADIVICLHRLAAMLGSDLYYAVDDKMTVNRKRTWRRDGAGCAYHVKGSDDV